MKKARGASQLQRDATRSPGPLHIATPSSNANQADSTQEHRRETAAASARFQRERRRFHNHSRRRRRRFQEKTALPSRHRRPPRDPQVPEIDRLAHPEAALCPHRPRGRRGLCHGALWLWEREIRGGRCDWAPMAEQCDLGAARSDGGVSGSLVRGCKSVCDSCPPSHVDAARPPACQTDSRRMGRHGLIRTNTNRMSALLVQHHPSPWFAPSTRHSLISSHDAFLQRLRLNISSLTMSASFGPLAEQPKS